jgi:hypothetical protein
MTKRKLIAGAVVWLFMGALGMALFYYVSPILEARFAPVLTDQKVEVIEREPTRVCWRWSWHKERYAQPTVIAWSLVVDGTAVEYPAVVSRKRDGEVIRDIRTATLGPGSNELCAKIPLELMNVPNLTIRGSANYALRHGLWTIWQELPVIPIPPP